MKAIPNVLRLPTPDLDELLASLLVPNLIQEMLEETGGKEGTLSMELRNLYLDPEKEWPEEDLEVNRIALAASQDINALNYIRDNLDLLPRIFQPLTELTDFVDDYEWYNGKSLVDTKYSDFESLRDEAIPQALNNEFIKEITKENSEFEDNLNKAKQVVDEFISAPFTIVH